MAPADLRLAAGQRDIDLADLVHREALADRLDPAEALQQCPQRRRPDAEDLDVDVLRRQAEQPISHPSADDERAAASLADSLGHRPRAVEPGFGGRH